MDINAERHRRDIWKRLVIVEPIKELVLTEGLLEGTKGISSEGRAINYTEQGGYFGGFYREGLYLVDRVVNLGLDENSRVSLKAPSKVKTIYEEMISREISNYRTCIFHSHPRITVEGLKLLAPHEVDEILAHAKHEMESGLHDYFKKEGRPLTLEEVVNEMVTRDLSAQDIAMTPGNYHLLISPTLSDRNHLSHLNFYKIARNRRLANLVKTRVASESDLAYFSQEFDKQEKVRARFNYEVFGFPSSEEEMDKMTPEQYSYAWDVLHGTIDPETGEKTHVNPIELDMGDDEPLKLRVVA